MSECFDNPRPQFLDISPSVVNRPADRVAYNFDRIRSTRYSADGQPSRAWSMDIRALLSENAIIDREQIRGIRADVQVYDEQHDMLDAAAYAAIAAQFYTPSRIYPWQPDPIGMNIEAMLLLERFVGFDDAAFA